MALKKNKGDFLKGKKKIRGKERRMGAHYSDEDLT